MSNESDHSSSMVTVPKLVFFTIRVEEGIHVYGDNARDGFVASSSAVLLRALRPTDNTRVSVAVLTTEAAATVTIEMTTALDGHIIAAAAQS